MMAIEGMKKHVQVRFQFVEKYFLGQNELSGFIFEYLNCSVRIIFFL